MYTVVWNDNNYYNPIVLLWFPQTVVEKQTIFLFRTHNYYKSIIVYYRGRYKTRNVEWNGTQNGIWNGTSNSIENSQIST